MPDLPNTEEWDDRDKPDRDPAPEPAREQGDCRTPLDNEDDEELLDLNDWREREPGGRVSWRNDPGIG